MRCGVCNKEDSVNHCPACDKEFCHPCSLKSNYHCDDCPPPPLRELPVVEVKPDIPFKKAEEIDELREIKMLPVKSSNVSELGYANGTMRVSFKSGQIYEYLSVPKQYYDNIISSGGSIGQAISMIKKNFRSRRAGSVG